MWNFKGYLWNSTQNILPIHWKINLLWNIEILRALRVKSSYAFLKRPPDRHCLKLCKTQSSIFNYSDCGEVTCLHDWLINRADCPACRTTFIATRFRVAVICPLFQCLTVLEFSFILFDLCLLITFFNFIMNYVPIVTFWIFTYHKIWILSIMFCFIWSYWIIYFLACL